jgi:hypothetical protein
MSSTEFGWESLLHTDVPRECKLQRALFTTYDRAEECLLAEHLLPELLRLDRDPKSEGAERKYFLIELYERLKQLHDRIVVVSSMTREEGEADKGESGTYGWIWRSIRHLKVGNRGMAVQHAKLWMLHWGADGDGDKYLEIVVSSANLTRSAFKAQLQGAWRVCLKLETQSSEAKRRSWGVLPEFLRELALSAGEDGPLDPFVELLGRTYCPGGVTFVASVPGTYTRQELRRTPWGAAGLREITPAGRGSVSVGILAPFVGSWNVDALNRWCAAFEGAPDRLSLIWIDENHPWARNWILPEDTLNTLTEMDATLLHLLYEPNDSEATDLFHEEHRDVRDRWSHAKVYSFRRGNSRRLLVTSANFSPAAWGRQKDNGELTIDNFELGVCIEQAVWPLFDNLEPFERAHDAATVSELSGRGSAVILWARAVWDGKRIDVACRCEAKGDLKGEIKSGVEWTPITSWMSGDRGNLHTARLPWTDSERPPLLVQLTCEKETVSIPVFDERPSRDREDTLPPELDGDPEDMQRMRDELLFEQYGGRVAEEDEGKASTNGDEKKNGDSRIPDSFTVPAFDLARQHLRVVENWADRVKRIGTRDAEEFERELLRRDGELLIEAFKRQTEREGEKEAARAIGPKLAAEELTLRLKHFREA